MGPRLALCLVALAGCDQLFSLQHVPARDGAAGDARLGDAPEIDGAVRMCGPTGSPVMSYGIGQQPWAVALGDLDRNGSVDIVATAVTDNKLNILLNDGKGAFTRAPDVDTGTQPTGLIVRELTGDGLVDVMVAAFGTTAVYLHPGRGDGTFSDPFALTAGMKPIAVTPDDIDGNGTLEIAVAAQGSSEIQLLTQSSGSFTQAGFVPTEEPQDVEIADINGDGAKDLVVLSQKTNHVLVYLGNGSLSFQATPGAATIGAQAHQLVIGSVDSDNKPDVLVSSGGAQAVDVLHGIGDGTFTNPLPLAGGASIYGFVLGDIDGDKDLDLVMAQFDGPKGIRTYVRESVGFAPTTDRMGAGAGEEVAIGDLDGLVPNDLVIVNWFENTATVVLGCL